MEKYNLETIKETRGLISKGEYGLSAVIKSLDVWFWGDTVDDVSDEMIEFALDIVNAYQSNKNKYDGEALEAVIDVLNEEVDDTIILNQLGTPIISVRTKAGASLMYGGVEEIGDHMPEVDLDRDLKVVDVALNG